VLSGIPEFETERPCRIKLRTVDAKIGIQPIGMPNITLGLFAMSTITSNSKLDLALQSSVCNFVDVSTKVAHAAVQNSAP
jgi:hypothetical protein